MAIGLMSLVDKVVASVIVAQDGSGDFNGTDETPIQDAIDYVGTDGGWIFIKQGVYSMNNTLTISDTQYGVKITGVPYVTNLVAMSDITLIDLQGVYCMIEDLATQGGGNNSALTSTIEISGGYNLIRNLFMSQCRYYGFNVTSNGNIIIACSLDNLTGGGIKINGSVRNHLLLNSIDQQDTEGILLADATKTIVQSNRIYLPYTFIGSYGIRETGTSDYNMVGGNICDSNETNFKVIGANTVIGPNLDIP